MEDETKDKENLIQELSELKEGTTKMMKLFDVMCDVNKDFLN